MYKPQSSSRPCAADPESAGPVRQGSRDGTSLPTFFGSSRQERNVYGMEIDSRGEIVITSLTRSPDQATRPVAMRSRIGRYRVPDGTTYAPMAWRHPVQTLLTLSGSLEHCGQPWRKSS